MHAFLINIAYQNIVIKHTVSSYAVPLSVTMIMVITTTTVLTMMIIALTITVIIMIVMKSLMQRAFADSVQTSTCTGVPRYTIGLHSCNSDRITNNCIPLL